mgnify:CR=1 FL=1
MIRLVEIGKDATASDGSFKSTPKVEAIVNDSIKFYEVSGCSSPWVSYLGVLNETVVGVCSFKSQPTENKVEIAYFTFPEHEGKGFASQMLHLLLKLAYTNLPSVCVSARTLKDSNASHRVLEKCGFTAAGIVVDPEDGEVLEWFHQSTSN